jgi:hypothetical protein
MQMAQTSGAGGTLFENGLRRILADERKEGDR